MRGIAAVLVLCGCDTLLHFQRVPDPPDAPVYLVCSQQQPAPFFCADFDTPTSPAYGDGIALTLPTPQMGIAAAAQPPGISPNNGLSVDTTADGPNNTYSFEYSSSAHVVTTLHADLEMIVATYDGTYSTEVVELGLVPPGAASDCHAQLQLDSEGLRLRGHNCTNNVTNLLFGAIPQTWAHILVDIDLTAGTATATYGLSSAQVPLDANAGGGNPYAAVGVFHVQNGSGPKLAFDDVLVTVK